MNYAEALTILARIWNEWPRSDIRDFLTTCVQHFFSRSLVKPCPLLDGNECQVYSDRPLACLLPNTWVYTQHGPRMIEHILAGDLVYGGDGRLHKVLATRSVLYAGPIVNVRYHGTHIDCWSTADHRWLRVTQKDKRKMPRPYWAQAGDLKAKHQHQSGDYLVLPAIFENAPDMVHLDAARYVAAEVAGARLLPFTSGKLFEGRVAQSIPRYWSVDDDFLFMMGLYLAEGDSTSQSTSFTMHKDERPILDRIAKYLQALDIPSHSTDKKNTAVLRVDSCLFARLMSALAGKMACHKALDEALFSQLSHAQKRKVYDAWDVGDGRKCLREKEFSTTTASLKLAMQMNFIALANGLFPRLYRCNYRNRIGVSYYDLHLFPSNFRQCKRGQGTKNMADAQFVYPPLQDIETQHYNGAVIDLQVEGVETFVTSSGVAHNCRLYGLWPAEAYAQRVAKMADALDLPKEQVPLNVQCPFVKRVNGEPLTMEMVARMEAALDAVDELVLVGTSRYTMTDAKARIKKDWNSRKIEDWALFQVFGEDLLARMSQVALRANPEEISAALVAFEQQCNALVEAQ